MRTDRRILIGAALAGPLALLTGAARAQADWRQVAVPLYAPADVVRGAWATQAAAALRLAQRAEALRAALQRRATDATPAATPAAQAAWREALLAWAAVSALSIGPVVARRSARRIDFSPTRPAAVGSGIERLAKAGPAGMDEVGGGARGFGALEWLLWSPQAPATPEARRYAAWLADDLVDEAGALAAAFDAGARRDPDDESLAVDFAELVNQWLLGLEALRVGGYERAAGRPGTGARALSGAAAAERQARWAALRAATTFAGGPVRPRPGLDPVPIETLLRGRGLNPLADRVVAATAAVSRAVAASGPSSARDTARALAALKHLGETQVADALQVTLAFSDADGD